jgi:hypothetical protein
MPFLAEEHIAISNQDLLSWMFDSQTYDQDGPVSEQSYAVSMIMPDCRRFISMLQIRNVPFLRVKLEKSRVNYVQASNQ